MLRELTFPNWRALLILCLYVGACQAAAPSPRSGALLQGRPPVRLEQGNELELAITGGETHEYQVDLLAGQFLNLVVEQEGSDVAVMLLAPNGRKITTVDSMNEDYGPEPLVAIAETSGSYRVVVASGNRDSLPGQYKIRIVELRTPAPGDEEHIAAERNIESARQLKSTGDGKDWDQAIAQLQEALQYYETAGAQDVYRHGLVLFSIGYLQAQKTRIRESIAAYMAALPLFQAAGDRVIEARTRNNLGGEYQDLGEPLKAMEYHQEALDMLPAGKDVKLQTAALNNLGIVHAELGDWTAALDNYEKAASGFAISGDWREQAIALRNVGSVYYSMNEPDQALRYLAQARQVMSAKSVHDPTLYAHILTDRAEVLLSQGQAAEALDACEQALKFRRVAGDSRREGDTLSVMGSIYHTLQQPEKAEQAFADALAKQQAAGYQFGSFQSLLHLGEFYLSTQRTTEAQDKLEQAMKIALSLGCADCKVHAELALARLQYKLGNLSASLQQTRSTLDDLDKVHAGIGPSMLRASFLSGYEGAYELYIDLSLHDPNRNAAGRSVDQAFQISERARARNFLETLSAMRSSLGQEDDSQLARKEQAVQSELAANAGELLKLWQGEHARGNLGTGTDVEDRIGRLEADFNLLEAQKATRNKGYAALTQPQYLSAAQVQEKLLDDQSVFLEYYLGEEKSYLWTISRAAISTYELPPRKQIESACRKLYELLKKHKPSTAIDNSLIAAAREISDLVLAPAAKDLQHERLIIAADGALQYIPFAALNRPGLADGYEPLVLSHEIVSVPSAAALAAQRELLAHRSPAERTLAIFADPVFSAQDPRLSAKGPSHASGSSSIPVARLLEHVQSGAAQSIPRLPFTAIEADKIFAMTSPGASLKAVGFDANRTVATNRDLSRYRYLHFATHGYMDSRHPELSALVLSLLNKRGEAEDGFLRLQDIYNLRLQADLVVLSACETGLGREIRGEGIIGLTRGFMYAGAPRVLVSLWDVSDQGTSELMPRFYNALLRQGKSPAAALRAAQIEMLNNKQWRDPYYWAAFTLQGEWK